MPSRKTEAWNFSAFKMIAGISQCQYKCKFEGRKYNSDQKRNNVKSRCEYKNPKEHNTCKKVIFGMLLHLISKMLNIQEVLLAIKWLRVAKW